MNHKSMQEELEAMRYEIAELKAARPAPRKKQSRLARIAIAAAMFLIPVVAFGVTITKPYTFVSGQPISASELNANFDTVYDRVNELGVYKVKVGTTVLGDAVSIHSGKQTGFITEEGYVSMVSEVTANSIRLGISHFTLYHTLPDCSDQPIYEFRYTKTVLNAAPLPGQSLVYGTGTHPVAVPGYRAGFGSCNVNSQAGTQSVSDFTTTAANDESVTGVPNSISGSLSITLQ